MYLRQIENNFSKIPISATASFLSIGNVMLIHLAEWISLRNQTRYVLGEREEKR